MLLSRNKFRESVFNRDNHKCVVCGGPAVDAHHIIERRLFEDGGYYIDNGCSLCEIHHLEAEKTILSPEHLRSLCGITNKILPKHMYDDIIYDKWGNPILPNVNRTKGELFEDQSVKKILTEGNVIHLFKEIVKYHRTYHVPWSDGMNDDDRQHPSMEFFNNKRVIVTEKMDGSNCSLYKNYIHGRSIEPLDNHPSNNWVKNFWSTINFDIPDNWRICGENMFAVHSIKYENLESYFLGFSIWDEKNKCLSWDDTKFWFELLGIKHAPILYDGIYDEEKIKSLWEEKNHSIMEGYVIRTHDSFDYQKFRFNVAKFVRKGHVQTNKHWKTGQAMTKNQLSNR